MTEVYMNLPKIKKRGSEDCWKIKKFQSRRTCINLSAGRKRECKNSLLFILKKYKIFNFMDWQYKCNSVLFNQDKRNKEIKKMTGFERVTIEQEFTRMMIEALKSNPSLSESIDNASKMGYAISFSFINGMCYTTLESKKEARRKVMEA